MRPECWNNWVVPRFWASSTVGWQEGSDGDGDGDCDGDDDGDGDCGGEHYE